MSIGTFVGGLWERAYGRLRSRTPNLVGDREIEWSWVAGHIPADGGKALDFGPGGSYLALAAAQRGYDVTAIDLGPIHTTYSHPRLRFIQGDLITESFPDGQFDLVLNCSTVEHVGLVGRYGVAAPAPDGDLAVMTRLRSLMKPGGRMLLTVPVGVDAVFSPFCRVYGAERLPRLLQGYVAEKEAFWTKDAENRWRSCSRQEAVSTVGDVCSFNSRRNFYALGLFVLRA